MARASTFVRSFLVVGILVSGVAGVRASQVTYSSLPLEVHNDANATDDHIDDIAAGTPVETSFLNSLSSYGTETYDEYSPGAMGTNVPNLTFGSSGITAADTFTAVVPTAPNTYSYSGNALVAVPGESGNTFYLSTPVTAFGTYIDQAGDADADTLSLLLQNTNNSFSEMVPIGTVGPNADTFNIFYFGVTDSDNPFNEVTLVTSNSDDGVLLDNTSVGFTPVPEPSSLALVCGGLLIGLGVFSVRRA